MRILLGQNARYFPAYGGGDKSNRLLIEALAQRGHTCHVVCRAADSSRPSVASNYQQELEVRGITPGVVHERYLEFILNGVEVRAVTGPDYKQQFVQRLWELDPDVVLLSTDDPALVLLEAALDHPRTRIVYLVRTTLALPFGPEAAFQSAARTELLRAADAVVCVSRYVAEYVRRWSGIPARAEPISLLEPGPYPFLGRYENPFVTLVNPCAVKGLSIFLALADQLPDVRFAAVPTWGTTEQDLAELRRRPNVQILPPSDQIDAILEKTKVLLVPSLWAEARSRIVVEAMLRGIPVLASQVGGIPEAKMGVEYLLPVRPIERYRPYLDERMVPVAEVPEQDIGPWLSALKRLLEDREHYEELARRSREVALEYARQLSVEPFEAVLEECLRRPPRRRSTGRVQWATTPVRIESLSPEKRALLKLRLRQQPSVAARSESCAPVAERWYPDAGTVGPNVVRLFCFPFAGAGAAVFRSWRAYAPAWVTICPACLPGREARSSEPPCGSVEELISRAGEALVRYVEHPYALYGHSMGALLAFELCRWLRRQGRPLPLALLVSGARAPQLRRKPLPEIVPSDEELLQELRDLGHLPKELDSEPDLAKYYLPILRADTTLARRYVYRDEEPLDIPICAYTGRDDTRLPVEVVQGWSEQTTASFRLAVLPGGHFFIQEYRSEFLERLFSDLGEIWRARPESS